MRTWTRTSTSLESLAREMPVDILAHPTLVTVPFREHRRRRAVDRGARGHESSRPSSMPASHSRSRIAYRPHERLVRRAVERGVRISLGSDGHTFDQIADVSRPLALARALGVRDDDLYDPDDMDRRLTKVWRCKHDPLSRALGGSHHVAADRARRRGGRRRPHRLRRRASRGAPGR